MKRRLLLTAAASAALAGCASPRLADYANETPQFDLRRYFTGTIDAWGVFTDRAGKVVKRFTLGEAAGQQRGNAFHWGYRLALPVDGKVVEVDINDWMYLMSDRVMLNKATMRKFGLPLGEVTLSFMKR